MKTAHLLWVLLLLACPIVLVYTIGRDSRYEREYASDLRNRVVGSRIIKDGGSPYFYKWKKGDGFRYYDPNNFDPWRPSICTSTPFLHQLLTPLVEMPEARISAWWLAIEYTLLALMTLFALGQAGTAAQKQAVLAVALLFLLTNAWKRHASYGQTYISIPFFATLFYVCWRRVNKAVWAIAAGLMAGCLVLIRPNTLLFFAPFLFLLPQVKKPSLLVFFIPVALLLGWTLLDGKELRLWKDYAAMVSEQTRIHQDLGAVRQNNEPSPQYRFWEGIDTAATGALSRAETVPIYSENGNVFVIYEHIVHRKLPLGVLAFLELMALAGAMGLFYIRRDYLKADIARAAIAGFCLYMISDLFSPVYRHQYYTVQWIFPLLLAATILSGPQKKLYLLLLAALLLGCIHIPFIKMGNTIGEYGMLVVLLAISVGFGRSEKSRSTPASLSSAYPNSPKN